MATGAVQVMDKPEQATEFLSSVDTLLLDCDGVLWRGSELVPGSAQVHTDQ